MYRPESILQLLLSALRMKLTAAFSALLAVVVANRVAFSEGQLAGLLHEAVCRGNGPAVRRLLQLGVDPSGSRDEPRQAWRPFTAMAVAIGQRGIFETLLQAGAL